MRLGQRRLNQHDALVTLALAKGGNAPLPANFSGLPVIDVTAPPFNADPTGATDSTAGVQAAVTFAQSQVKVIGNVFLGPLVWFRTGIYKVSAPTPGEACIEVPDGINIAGTGAALYDPTNQYHLMRWANYQQSCTGMTFFGGQSAIACNGPSRVYGGSLGTVTANSTIVIDKCFFRYNAGASIWLDTSLEHRGSTASMVISNADCRTAVFFYGGFDGAVVSNLNGAFVNNASLDPSAVVVLDDEGHALPFIFNYGSLALTYMLGVPVVDTTLLAAWLGGSGTIKSYGNRFGGESNLTPIWKKKINGIGYRGELAASVIDSGAFNGAFLGDSDAYASTANDSWALIFDSFPNQLVIRNPQNAQQFDNTPPVDNAVLVNSYGVFIDSVTCSSSNYDNVDARNIIIDLSPQDLSTVMRFRSGTSSRDPGGQDVTDVLRRYFTSPTLQGSRASGAATLGEAANLFAPGKLQGLDFTTGSYSGVPGSEDTSTGYTLTAQKTTIDNGFIDDGFAMTGLAVGEYTISFALKANFSGTLLLQTEVGLATRVDVGDLQFGGNDVWQRLELSLVHDGVDKSIFFHIDNMPTANVSEATLAFFAIQSGRAARPWILPGNPTVDGLVTVGVRGTAPPTTGTWKQGDIVWNSAPTSGGPIGWVCLAAGTPGTWAAFGTIR